MAIAVGVLSACAAPAQQSAPDGTIRLLDAIVSWARVGDADWAVVDDELRAIPGSGDGFIILPGEFADFEMQLEFWIPPGTNSGVFLRCQDVTEITPWTCYEVNLWDQHPNQAHRTGSIVAVAEPLAMVATENRWNTLTITASGNRLTVVVNDTVTARARDDRLRTGAIALQRFGDAQIRFRNIRLLIAGGAAGRPAAATGSGTS